ncbi:MAG: 4Fe-4S binding protein [Proteobacteria bacterium]|nr:4Fe-4S binding protein [Pseudomonadota bacterium]
MKRQIIRIDESKCTGCGLCVPNCAEGSLEIRGGKAVLVKEALCDGLGACLGHCPEGALIIEERDAEAFDEHLVEQRLQELGRDHQPAPVAASHGGACPSSRPVSLGGGCPSARPTTIAGVRIPAAAAPSAAPASELTHWPVQLGLLPPTAPFFRGAELLLAADCVPFAYPDFHRTLLKGRAVAVACPKLDNAGAHFQKLIQIFRQGGLKGVTVVRMEVPCCGGLSAMAAEAWKESGAAFPLRELVISRGGEILEERGRPAVANA